MLIRRFFGPLFLGLLAAAGYYALNRFGLNIGLVELNAYYGEQFFAVLSTLYAILTALVLLKGLQNADALTAALLHEATKIRSIAGMCDMFEGEAARASMRLVRGELRMFVENILEQQSASRSMRNDGAIDHCRKIIARMKVEGGADPAIKMELLRELEALRLLRSERASIAGQRLPLYMVWMIAALTLAIIAPFFVEHTRAVHFNYYAIFAIGAFGSFVFLMIRDINRPYEGLWAVDFSPFREAAEALEETGGRGD